MLFVCFSATLCLLYFAVLKIKGAGNVEPEINITF